MVLLGTHTSAGFTIDCRTANVLNLAPIASVLPSPRSSSPDAGDCLAGGTSRWFHDQ